MQAILAGAIVAFCLSAAILVSPTATADQPASEKAKAESLEGNYTIVSGERDGKALPGGEVKGALVRITDGKIVGTDAERKEFFAATYKLDTTKKPWKIDMKTALPAKLDPNIPKEPMSATGLVKNEGETLTIIYALPGGEAPKEFKTKEKQQMFVMKPAAEKLPNKFQPAPPIVPPKL